LGDSGSLLVALNYYGSLGSLWLIPVFSTTVNKQEKKEYRYYDDNVNFMTKFIHLNHFHVSLMSNWYFHDQADN